MLKNGSTTGLEAEFAVILQEFVGRLVDAIRNASFADVAALSQYAAGPPRKAVAVSASKAPARTKQTASHRAELEDRVVRALAGAGRPLGVRALSTELGIAADRLSTPLRDLRVAGRIKKHGEKRATTYSTI